MADKVTLGYWKIRGFAERIRLLLELLHIPYEQNFFTYETRNEWFEGLRPELTKQNPAANLPYFLDGDKVITESGAIMVYLCHRANRADLLGQTADDQVQIATVLGVLQDMHKAFVAHVYGQRSYEQFKEEAYNGLKGGCTKMSGLLGEKDWFGSKFTYVDIILGDAFQVYSLFHENFAEDFPTLKAHQERVWNLDGISQYIKSERYIERPISFFALCQMVMKLPENMILNTFINKCFSFEQLRYFVFSSWIILSIYKFQSKIITFEIIVQLNLQLSNLFPQNQMDEQPIKKRITDLKQQIELIRTQNADSKKVIDLAQKQMKVLESRLQDPFNVVKDYFALSTKTLNTNYEKDCILYEEQVHFLHQQINSMTDDKVKATQSCLILQQKIRNLSQDIGV